MTNSARSDFPGMVNNRQRRIAGTQIGVISDTHGLLRPEAIEALTGSDLILHAGDIGKPEILEELSTIAPVVAVRGNNDTGDWARTIPESETISVENVSIHLLHIAKDLRLDPKRAGVQVVISGHSHKPSLEEREGILFLNPGSAGPRRFKLPISVACLYVKDNTVNAQVVDLLKSN
ncbi:metallophosphoesterase family protein [Leptolyngbya sp. AN03gr2]|uniref:metallophosphoesterase family protein n=1 Tax=unclassified Leptolyngbya TaxID=2650499 RepID=UPI003D31C426